VSEADAPDELLDEPPSVKFVYAVLENDGPLSRPELVEETLLPERTVGRATNRLLDAGLIDSTADPRDSHRRIYDVPDE